MFVGTIYTESFFIFIDLRVFVDDIGKLDFLHFSKLVTAKFFLNI